MSTSFTIEHLRTIVELGGRALELEDRFICGCLHRNTAYRGSRQPAGIAYLKDERYYQRLIVRGLLPSFPYIVKPEYRKGRGPYDIAVLNAPNEEPVALGELKLWMDKGRKAIPKIASDIKKLASEACKQFVLVFTSARKDLLEECIEDLLKSLECCHKAHPLYRFDSEFDSDGHGNIEPHAEFALIGILLKGGVPECGSLTGPAVEVSH